MIPRIFHQTARGALSWEERRLVRRLRRVAPGWDHRLWSDADNARLIGEHFPVYLDRYEAIRFGVAKSDIARYAYMHVHGGIYLDTDYRLFRPLSEHLLGQACLIPLEGADPHDGPAPPDYPGLGNAFLASRPGYPFWARLIAHIFEEQRPETIRESDWIIPATGPEALTRFYLAHAAEYPDIALPKRNDFYPRMSWLGTRTTADAETYGVHLCWARWRDQPVSVAARNLVRRKLNGLLS